MDRKREPQTKTKRYVLGVAGIATLALITVGLATLDPAVPTVEAATIWTDAVKRGNMLREVRGPGTLVPEKIRWISSVTAGRVEVVHVQPGREVNPSTILLEIRNPDVGIEALQADRQLSEAEAQLVNLRAGLATDRLTQKATVAEVRAEYLNAQRTAKSNEFLAERGLIAEPDLISSRERAAALATRLEVEEERIGVTETATHERIRAQQQQIEGLRAVVVSQRQRVEAMVVRAGVDGVVTELSLEEGQWVTPGQTLARVVQPGRLKAVLRISEVQAKDIAIGQTAKIDTRNGVIPGRVARIDPAVENGTVNVDVVLEGELPRGARPDLSVDGTIEVERLVDVLHVGRPTYGQAESTVGIFKLLPSGNEALRVTVQLGRSSVNTIEIVRGLQEGDVVILSDLSAYDDSDRIRVR